MGSNPAVPTWYDPAPDRSPAPSGRQDRRLASTRPATVVSDRVLTVPNAISLARLAVRARVRGAHPVGGRTSRALVVLLLAGASDYVDGLLARRWEQVTRLGQLLDPAADRLYVTAALLGLGWRGVLPWWLVALVVVREVVLTANVLVLRRHGLSSLPPHLLGKAATFVLLVALPLLLLAETAEPVAVVVRPVAWALVAVGHVPVLVGRGRLPVADLAPRPLRGGGARPWLGRRSRRRRCSPRSCSGPSTPGTRRPPGSAPTSRGTARPACRRCGAGGWPWSSSGVVLGLVTGAGVAQLRSAPLQAQDRAVLEAEVERRTGVADRLAEDNADLRAQIEAEQADGDRRGRRQPAGRHRGARPSSPAAVPVTGDGVVVVLDDAPADDVVTGRGDLRRRPRPRRGRADRGQRALGGRRRGGRRQRPAAHLAEHHPPRRRRDRRRPAPAGPALHGHRRSGTPTGC